jgi:biopolymer transport protein ExbB/biopolymer transport protein TolQ
MLTTYLSRVALLGSGWVLYVLLGLSVCSFACMFERWRFFRRNNADAEQLRRDLGTALRSGDDAAIDAVLGAHPSVEARVLRAAFAWRQGGPEAFEDALESELGRVRPLLERGSTLLGTIGNNAPFVGLFGTVIGVIEAFHHLGAGKANAGAMANVMNGIAEALIATAVGIFVAIPAVVAFNVSQKRVDEVENDLRSLAKLLSAWLKTGRDHHASALSSLLVAPALRAAARE